MNTGITFFRLLLITVLLTACGGGGGSDGGSDGDPPPDPPAPEPTTSTYGVKIVEVEVVRADSGETVPVSELPLDGAEITMPDE